MPFGPDNMEDSVEFAAYMALFGGDDDADGNDDNDYELMTRAALAAEADNDIFGDSGDGGDHSWDSDWDSGDHSGGSCGDSGDYDWDSGDGCGGSDSGGDSGDDFGGFGGFGDGSDSFGGWDF